MLSILENGINNVFFDHKLVSSRNEPKPTLYLWMHAFNIRPANAREIFGHDASLLT